MSERVAAVLIDPATGLPYTAIPVNIGSTVNRTASGNITSTQSVALSTAACGSAAFQVSGTWTGTLVFEYTINNLSWVALSVTPDGGGAAVSSTTANGNWSVQVESYSQVRVRGNTVGSDTAAVFLSASTATSVVTVAGPIPTGDNTIGRVKITDGTDVAAVSAGGALSVDASATTALPLPTGAATAAAQATGNASLSSIDSKTPALVTGRVPVDGSGVTQPVSGTVTANAGSGTFAISAAALPLPSGAATAAKQPALGVAGTASADVLSVQGIAGAVAVKTDGSATTQPVSIAGTVAISAAALPLPSDAATATLQTTGNTSLATLATNSPALGQAAMAASVPVAIASNQSAVPVSGTVTANAGTGTFAVSNANLDVALSTLSLKNQFPTTLGVTTKATSLSVAVASDQIGTAGTAASAVLSVQGVASMTALQVTPPAGIGQQTLANSLSIGLNSSQVGTAGSAATTVLSVQGVASGTPLPVVPAPATGTYITANATTTAITGSAAILYAICVNPGITSALLIYNSNGTNANLVYSGSTAAPPNMYDITFGSTGMSMPNGITYTTSGGTPASVLFLWRAA